MDIKKFYSDKRMSNVSKRGYYPEKFNFILEYLKRHKGVKLVDLACNEGYLTKKYSKYADVVGVDINPASVKKCKERGIECIHADVTKLPAKLKNKFDVVVANDIIEHIFDTDEFLREIKKVLKKDGTLLLTTANVASIGRRIMLLFGKNPYLEYSVELPYKDFNVGHVRYYTLKDLEDQLKYHGFENIHIYGDRINITSKHYLGYDIAKFLPSISRNFLVSAVKK